MDVLFNRPRCGWVYLRSPTSTPRPAAGTRPAETFPSATGDRRLPAGHDDVTAPMPPPGVLPQSSVALHVLRGVEEYRLKNTTHNITVRTTPETALYLLNQKRNTIVDYETRFGVEIIIESDANLETSHFEIDRGEPVENPARSSMLYL